MPPSGVTTATLYDGPHQPCPNGLMSRYMGSADDRTPCLYCHHTSNICTGHPGHIVLSEPVYNTEHLGKLTQIMHCFCPHCSKCIFDCENPASDPEVEIINTSGLTGIQRLAAFAKLAKRRIEGGLICSACEGVPYTWTSKTPFLCYRPVAGSGTQHKIKSQHSIEVMAQHVLDILEPVPEEEYRFLGIGRADNMIFKVFPVITPRARPSLIMTSRDNTSSFENDLTYLLQTIVNSNRPGNGFELQGAVAAYITSERAAGNALPERGRSNTPVRGRGGGRGGRGGGRAAAGEVPIRNTSANRRGGRGGAQKRTSVTEREKGKYGRMRKDVISGRTNYSGRFVVGPDPLMHPTYVGVPEKGATVCTKIERVFALNQKLLTKIVKGTPAILQSKKKVGNTITITKKVDYFITACCATKIHMPDDHTFVLTDDPNCLTRIPWTEDGLLPIGATVERWQLKGDRALFNRAPSIAFSSVTCCKSQPIAANVLKFSTLVTNLWHMDFDGDEMLHIILQLFGTIAEFDGLANNAATLIDPQDGSSLMGLIQWAVYGIWLLTQRDTLLTFTQFCDLMTVVDGEQARRDSVPGDTKVWEPLHTMPEPIVPPSTEHPRGQFSGRQILSMITPVCFFGDVSKLGDDKDPFILHAGDALSGVWTKKHVSVCTSALTLTFSELYGRDVAIEWLWKINRLALFFMDSRGNSINYADVHVPEELQGAMTKVALEGKRKAEELIHKARMAGTKVPSEDVLEVLRSAREECGVALQGHVDAKTNGFVAGVKSGARGKETSITHAMACMGPQQVNNDLYDGGFRLRSSPNVPRNAADVESSGYVVDSISAGLSVQSMVASAASGRDGVIGTAVNTSRSGQMQRELAHGLSFVASEVDLSVRAGDKLLQRVYGMDGVDPRELFGMPVEQAWTSTDEFLEHLASCTNDWKNTMISYRHIMREYLLHNDPTGNDTTVYLPLQLHQYVETALYHSSSNRSPVGVKLDGDDGIMKADEMWERVLVLIDEIRQSSRGRASTFLIEYQLLLTLRYGRTHSIRRSWWLAMHTWILTRYRKALVQPKISVGGLAEMSISRGLTQMTLDNIHFTGQASNHMEGVGGVVQIAHFGSKTDDMKHKRAEHDLVMIEPFSREWDVNRQVCVTLVDATLGNVIKGDDEIIHDPDGLVDGRLWRELEYYSSVMVQTYGFGGGDALYAASVGSKRNSRSSRLPARTDVYGVLGLLSVAPKRSVASAFGESVGRSVGTKKGQQSMQEDVVAPAQFAWNPYVVKFTLDIAACVRFHHTPESLAQLLFEQYGPALKVAYTSSASTEWYLMVRCAIPLDRPAPVMPRVVENPTEDDLRQQRLMDASWHMARRTRSVLRSSVHVNGIRGLYETQVSDCKRMAIDQETGAGVQHEEFFIRASGLNSVELAKWWFFDHKQTVCTDPQAVLESQGILGAQAMIPQQLVRMTAHVGHIHRRHFEILAAQMCYRGTPASMSKSGIGEVATTPLSRAAFSAPTEMIGNGAAESRTDPVSEVMDAIIVGGRLSLGTDTVHLFMDLSEASRLTRESLESEKRMPPMPPPPAKTDFWKQLNDAAAKSASNARLRNIAAGKKRVRFELEPQADISAYSWPTEDGGTNNTMMPSSPRYIPSFASPQYSAASPVYSVTSPLYSAASPVYSAPSSPLYSAASPMIEYDPENASMEPRSPNDYFEQLYATGTVDPMDEEHAVLMPTRLT